METKKTKKADLERWKPMSLLMGLTVAVAFLFVCFEWGAVETKAYAASSDGGIEWVEEIPITMPEPTPPPPPPPAPLVADLITVVENTLETPDTPILTTEDTPDNPQGHIYAPPAAVEEEVADADEVFVLVEQMPKFPGGDPALLRFINQSIKYPVIAQENGIQGRVVCSFVVNRDGSVVDVEVVRGVDPSIDKEAMRVVGSMPKWEPGSQRGKPVRVRFTVPITFRLQ